MQYMKSKEHGTHIAYSDTEIVICQKNGWVCVDHPHDNPFETVPTKVNKLVSLEEKSVEELKEIAKDKGIKVHHMAGKDKILKLIKG